MKIYTLIGGVNGAGKSSLTGSLRAERSDLGQIVDPDALTARCGGDEYEAASWPLIASRQHLPKA